ncbi:MAG TPA: Hsp70 family protein, partial [Flavobacteriales bacterium]|nr:Hsp70 family protein [Flavobacteriales bacterium]
GIPPARRGTPQIEVTFDIDANGILNVAAKDKATGKEQQIRIEASSGLSKDDIDKMKREAEANADADKQAREKADKLNQADSLIFQTEKQLAEFGDKLPADKKQPIEEVLAKLKKAHEAQDVAAIETAMHELNAVFSSASEEMYKAAQQAQTNGSAGNTDGQGHAADQEVTDVDFEEVKDNKN